MKFPLLEQIQQHLLHCPGYNPHEMMEPWHVEDTFIEHLRSVEIQRPETKREPKSLTKSRICIRHCGKKRVIL